MRKGRRARACGRMFHHRQTGGLSFVSQENVATDVSQRKQGTLPIDQENHKVRFYKSYRKDAGEYDKGSCEFSVDVF